MASAVFVDRGYKTSLGTAFYDRLADLDKLAKLLGGVRTVIVYGPRNVGKSELARYAAMRRLKARSVLVDSRRRSLNALLGFSSDDEILLKKAGELLAASMGLPRGLVGIIDEVLSRISQPQLIIVDELHLLFEGDLERALSSLEASAGLLAKEGSGRPRLIVTVSEGFFATARAVSRLLGYSTAFMLVEPMDVQAFEALYDEYKRLYGCKVGLEAMLALSGPLPGYLPDLCGRSEDLLAEWIAGEARKVYSALHEAAVKAGLSVDNARKAASRLLRGEPAEDPALLALGEALVEHNIAYPCPATPPIYLPQLPVYEVLVETKNSALDPRSVVKALKAEALRRCADL